MGLDARCLQLSPALPGTQARLPTFPSLSLPTPLRVWPGITSPRKRLPPDPCLKVYRNRGAHLRHHDSSRRNAVCPKASHQNQALCSLSLVCPFSPQFLRNLVLHVLCPTRRKRAGGEETADCTGQTSKLTWPGGEP